MEDRVLEKASDPGLQTPGDPEAKVVTRRLADEVEAISELLRGAWIDEIDSRIGAARAQWPNDLSLKLLEGAAASKAGRFDVAERCFREAHSAHPGNPFPLVRLNGLLLDCNRVDEAAALFSAEVWTGSAPIGTRNHLLARLCQVILDGGRRRRFLSSLLRETGDDRFILLKLASLEFREHRPDDAQRYFEAARRLGDLPTESRSLELEIAMVTAKFDRAYVLASALHREYPNRPDLARRAVQTSRLARRHEEMVDLLRSALRSWPREWMLLYQYTRSFCPGDVDREMFARLSDVEPEMRNDGRWLFQFAVLCLRHGQTSRAVDILARFTPDNPAASMGLPLRAALTAYPVEAWSVSRGVINDVEREIQIVRVPEAKATVFVMAGVYGGVGYSPFTSVDCLLARLAVNVVYLRDAADAGFTTGVRALGPDTASMAVGLNAIASDLGGRVIVIGGCLGGLAAFETAALLRAHAGVSFAGPIHLGAREGDEDLTMNQGGRTRGAIFNHLVAADQNLIARLTAANGTWFHQCFGQDYPPDVEDANLIRRLPNVRLHGIAGCKTHHVVEHMIASGRFHEVLQEAIDQTPPDPQ